MTDHAILVEIRRLMARAGVDLLLIPRGDAFGGEEVPPKDERLAFVSGFTGSAGLGIIAATDKPAAMLFSDGRYTLQMEKQKYPGWGCATMPGVTPEDWLTAHYGGCRLGFDPMLMPIAQLRRMKRRLAPSGIEMIALEQNPVDAIWPNRPPPPSAPAFDFDEAVAGMTRRAKITAISDAVVKKALGGDAGGDAGDAPWHMLITDPAILCWMLNIRGRDLDHTPFLLAFGVLADDGEVAIYAEAGRLADIKPHGIRARDPGMLLSDLAEAQGRVVVDPVSCPVAFYDAIGAEKLEAENPAILMKARKTPQEIAAIKSAHRTDAAAMIRFLHWFDRTIATRPLREAEIDTALLRFRAASPDFLCPSFATICGGGGHGAIIHYRAVAGEDAVIPLDSLCLIDSGAQYRHGTTDITRTIATGTPPHEMAAAFTHVLRAHIALAQCRFPVGTTGGQIDAITRAPLWRAGMDYAHGTGHGVGCCLSVHEGPASISKTSTRAIEPGMVLSNEPGFYTPDEYGIRIENLVCVMPPDEAGMLAFETISLAPIDRRLIITALLTEAERDWIDAYHRRIEAEVTPHLVALGDDDLMAWLAAATAPLEGTG